MPFRAAPLTCVTALWVLAAAAIAQDGVVAVKLGAAIPRTLEEVKAAGFAYGPRQEVDPATGETHVFLPYGPDAKLYWGAVAGNLSQAADGHCAEFVSTASDKAAALTYKLAFDKPIASFRCQLGYAELVMAPTCVAGLEYSVDGKTWKTAKEAPKGTKAVIAPFVEPYATVTGLDTRVLLLRIYARDADHPAATSGPEMYLKMRISGDPGWGDAASTFFASQNQVWVNPK